MKARWSVAVAAACQSALFAIGFASALSACAGAERSTGATYDRASEDTYRAGPDGMTIEVRSRNTDAIIAVCRTDRHVSQARLSTDARSLIVSENGFLPLVRLEKCNDVPVQVQLTPESAGLLQDINLENSLYVSLVPVAAQPLAYLAVVAQLGSSINTVSMLGAMVDSQSKEQQQRQAFSYADDTGPFAMISRDGRYVDPSGRLDCSADAYPGVWDLATKKKVVVEGNPRARATACRSLFLNGGNR